MMMARQAGVALVSVLLVVAIATVLAVSMIQEQQASISVTRGFLGRGQAAQYALGGEELARQILHEDFELQTGVDHRGELWAADDLAFEFEDGEVTLQITDLQGLLNLNALSNESTLQQVAGKRFVNLLSAAGADPVFVEHIRDWIDVDSAAQPGGAEDFEYLIFEPPYRAGNGPMWDASEIDLLSVPPEIRASIAPYVTALPDIRLAININTAPAAVLQTLASGLSFEAAESLAERAIDEEGFKDLQAFMQAPELAGLGIDAQGLGVQSIFFEIRTIARYQDRFSYLTSIVHRNPVDGSMRVISRDFSKTFRPVLSADADIAEDAEEFSARG